ncbi:hypothetical protein Taro_027435, partial [Colocasia esculenta]|nr:hypothetical protein [Colocasia esculenta]
HVEQVQDVVLLDEDVQTIEQIQEEDEPVERLPSSNKEAKIYYPSRNHPECVELFQSDIKCLEPESYLSSTIMNFYIQYLQNSIASSGRPKGEYHFCNTYFYCKLEEAMSHKLHIARVFNCTKSARIEPDPG